MTSGSTSSLFFTGATGLLGGALLLAGEPVGALLCGAVAVATGGYENRRRWVAAPRVSFWAAAAAGFPGSQAGRWPRRAKFLVRAAWQRRATRAWVNRLQSPAIRALWASRPRLTSKLQRPYLCRDWAVPERLAALDSHYRILGELLAAPAREQIYREGLTLVRLVHAASGRQVDLRLVYRDQFEKEGELSLTVEEVATRLTLAGLTFCLVDDGIRRIAWIGGVQASADPRTRGLIADVAKEMHGLRPKALALWALRQLVVPWRLAHLRAVGNGDHAHRHWHRPSAFAVNYEEFWAESGGRAHAGGGWELPLVVARRRREEIKPSRRKAYDRRYALLAELRAELLAAYSALTPDATIGEAAGLPRICEY
jgi:uncharacterized protein VirK/YbjX